MFEKSGFPRRSSLKVKIDLKKQAKKVHQGVLATQEAALGRRFQHVFLKLLIETINDTASLSGRAVAKRAKEEFFKMFFL